MLQELKLQTLCCKFKYPKLVFIYTLDRLKKIKIGLLRPRNCSFTNFVISNVRELCRGAKNSKQQQQQTVIFYFTYLGPVNLPVITSSRYEPERRLENAVYGVARSWYIKGTDKFLP